MSAKAAAPPVRPTVDDERERADLLDSIQVRMAKQAAIVLVYDAVCHLIPESDERASLIWPGLSHIARDLVADIEETSRDCGRLFEMGGVK